MEIQRRRNYKILFLTNKSNEEFEEDKALIDAFVKDGNQVTVAWVDYQFPDENFDIIIRRNTWTENLNMLSYYKMHNDKLKERLQQKNIKTVNLVGLDGLGKRYLSLLYIIAMDVIPTVTCLDNINALPKSDVYILKDNSSFGSGINQKTVSAEELSKTYLPEYIIQPKIDFCSEIQCYFVGEELLYSFEYTPSKYPDYPTPRQIVLDSVDEAKAKYFANFSDITTGVKRVDFLKLKDGKLMLLEIEDNCPCMNFKFLKEDYRKLVIQKYVDDIYKYLEGHIYEINK